MSYKIAIDGPASAGKSTTAKMLAKELGYIYIDTGAIYRTLALFLLNNNVDPNDENEISKIINDVEITIEYENDNQIVKLNGKDVSDKIRTQVVSDAASKSSVHKVVREKLLSLQRDLAENNNCVMDGRDIASKVLPNANLKIFLTASAECRAKRRYEENLAKGISSSYEETLKDIEERDYRDTHRENDPLKQVDDAILIDSTNMTVDEVIDKILSYV